VATAPDRLLPAPETNRPVDVGSFVDQGLDPRLERTDVFPAGAAAADWVRVIRLLRKRGARRPVHW